MNKIYFLISLFWVSLHLTAQNPCDAKLFDKVRASVGENVTYIQSMMSTEKGDRVGYGAFSMTLNEGVIYRFTIGTSELSEVDVFINLHFGNTKNIIKEQRPERGKIINYDFKCDRTGRYSIVLSYKEKGKCCTNIILSKVNK